MEIDILFKAKISNDVFKELPDGWYLAPTDNDTFKYTLMNIYQACPDGLDGIILKMRNFKYTDTKQLWASISVDRIIAELNPGGDNVTNWISDSLDIIGNESLSVMDTAKELGVWIDEDDIATVVIDAWKEYPVKTKEAYNTISKIIDICTHDNNIVSIADAMDVILQYNKLSNAIVGDFLSADAMRVIEIARETFDCDLTIMVDTKNITKENNTVIPRAVKDNLWKLLVYNRGRLDKLAFNVDTNTNDIEIYKLQRFDDVKGTLKIENVILCDCDINDADLVSCVVYKSTFHKCKFTKCRTLGVRVRLQDCKDYKEELEGQYTVVDDDKEE